MTTKMKATKVYRGGRTTKKRGYETNDVKLNFKGSYWNPEEESFQERPDLCLVFSLASKGGGTTDVQISIGQGDFAPLLDAMVRVDRRAAMAAMSAELAEQLEELGVERELRGHHQMIPFKFRPASR